MKTRLKLEFINVSEKGVCGSFVKPDEAGPDVVGRMYVPIDVHDVPKLRPGKVYEFELIEDTSFYKNEEIPF